MSDLKQLLVHASRSHSDRFALIDSHQTLTYKQLLDRSSQLARWLISRGLGPGKIVPLAFERSADMIVAMVAVIYAGAAYLPIDIEAPTARINDILSDSRATQMLSTISISKNIAFSSQLTVHCIDSIDFISTVSAYDVSPPEQEDLIIHLGDKDAPYVIYTSGTTGTPKGVVNTHQGVANSLLWMKDTLQLNQADVCLLKAPYTFDLSVWEIFVPLSIGGCLVIAEPGTHRSPGHIANLITQHEVTLAYFVPTMLGELLSDGGMKRTSPLRNVVAIGEALTSSLQAQFHAQLPDAVLWNSYGPTEAAVGVTLWRCSRDENNRPPPLGYPAWNTHLYVLDENLEQVLPGRSGEIYISGLQVASGYLEQPSLTRERFLNCPFELPQTRMYRTGDFGVLREDGHIDFLGRQDGQLKLNGIRVELGEIEASIRSLPGIARCAVVPRLVQGATMLVAYLVMREGVAEIDHTEFSEVLVTLLPNYMIPSMTVALEALPLTTSGKLDVKALPEPEISRFVQYRAPEAGLETELATLFSELTGFASVGADHSFFALGGTSLMAMRLAGRLKARTGLALPMRALVECPTPAKLAVALQAANIDLGEHKNKPVVLMFPGAGGDDLQYARLGARCAAMLDLRTLPYPDWRFICRANMTFDDVVKRFAELIEAMLDPGAEIRLCGYSLGGDVAFNVASRLEAVGRKVLFLGLIDTDAPKRNGELRKGHSILERATSLRRKNILLRRLRDKLLDKFPSSTLPLVARIMADWLKITDVDFQMSKRVMIRLRSAWQKEFQTKPVQPHVRMRTILFQSEADVDLRFVYDGWPERCENLTVVPVLGTHMTMLDDKYLDDFASIFVRSILQNSPLQRASDVVL